MAVFGGRLRRAGARGGPDGDARILDASVVTAAHVEQAIERVRPSLDPDQLEYLENYADDREP
ncbi:hypothetical protein GCM10029992_18670 [Glycomyces albus]